MRSPPLPRLAHIALRALRLLAPPELRDRWLREWEGELTRWWQGRKSGIGSNLRLASLIGVAALDTRHLRSLQGHHTEADSSPASNTPTDPPIVQSILQDARFAYRAVRNAPWLSLVTATTLALGIGASVAMSGVLHGVFLRPLPFPEAERLVVGRATIKGVLNPWAAGADYYDYRDESDAFEELTAIMPFSVAVTVSGDGEAERVSANVVSPNFFPGLRTQPAVGRLFQREDGLEGAQDVVVLSYGFWQRRMGADPQTVGRSLVLDGSPVTVVGVMPRDFFFLARADLWFPMRPDQFAASMRDRHNWYLVGRLNPGITLEQAQAGVDVISLRLQGAYPETNQNKALLLTGLHRVLTDDYRQSIWILTGAVILVLLIACGNGAGILLARAPARRFELSIRGAMGAPRERLIRQLLLESLGIALAAGVVGTVLALWFQGVMLEYLALDALGLDELSLSLPTLAAALGISLFSGLLAGVYPAMRSADTSLTDGLNKGNRGRGDSGTGFRSGLVVAQVALSVVLLAGSGLLVRSLSNLETLNPGFDPQGLLTAEIQLPGAGYPDATSRTQFFSTLHDKLLALPGVASATFASHLPIKDFGNVFHAYPEGNEEQDERTFLRSVGPGYFRTLDIPVLAGRGVEDGDGAGAPNVVVISQTAARRFFPSEDPLGKVVMLNLSSGPRPMEVVGVAGDVRLSRLEEDPEAALYLPYAQRTSGTVSVALKILTPPEGLAGTLREVVRMMDPAVPLTQVANLEALVAESMAERRVITLSLILLSLLPLALASVGLFAVLAYHVSRRRHEMGIRLALGANPAHVGRLVLGQGLRLVWLGVGLGLVGAWGGTRLLQGLLFGVETTDPVTFLGVTGLVLTVSALACAIPVWRAARSDPTRALQAE